MYNRIMMIFDYKIKKLMILCIGIIILSSTIIPQEHLDEKFEGTYRKTSKTSIVRNKTTLKISSPHIFANVGELLDFTLPDVDMKEKYSDLKVKTTNKRRKTEELYNVEVVCWIHGVKYEGGTDGDRDFHIIIGDDEDINEAKPFMNAEISGLPSSGKNLQPLHDVRKQFLDMFSSYNFNTEFEHIDPPVKVRLRGSLFFDGAHGHSCASCPGPSWAKPKTVWEIHPIYSVIQEP